MWGVIAFLCGVGLGAVGAGSIVWIAMSDRDRLPRPELPPATPVALARLRRRRRADIRPALERPAYDKRQWLPTANEHFDREGPR